jgi:cytochrome c553
LNDYREGARDNQIMSSMAESINRADMQLYAQRIAAHEWPQTPAAQIASPSSLLQSCMGCHGANLGGQQTPVGYAPRLAGQNDGYLLEQMQSFVNGVRANQPAMSALMQALSDDEQRQLAQVIAHLP